MDKRQSVIAILFLLALVIMKMARARNFADDAIFLHGGVNAAMQTNSSQTLDRGARTVLVTSNGDCIAFG